jgi:hypothetical protein
MPCTVGLANEITVPFPLCAGISASLDVLAWFLFRWHRCAGKPPIPKHYPVHTPPIPKHYPVHTTPMPKHYPVHTTPIPKHYPVHTTPIPKHYPVHTTPMPKHYPVHTTPIPKHYPVHTTPIPKHYPVHTTPIPKHYPVHTPIITIKPTPKGPSKDVERSRDAGAIPPRTSSYTSRTTPFDDYSTQWISLG